MRRSGNAPKGKAGQVHFYWTGQAKPQTRRKRDESDSVISRAGLDKKSLMEKLTPPIKEQVETLFGNDTKLWEGGEFQTRLVFRIKEAATKAMTKLFKGCKAKPLPKGKILAPELLWAS